MCVESLPQVLSRISSRWPGPLATLAVAGLCAQLPGGLRTADGELDTTTVESTAEVVSVKTKRHVDGGPEIVWLRRIWTHGRWNGRGELIRFKGRWYCAFKEGLQHTNERIDQLEQVGCRVITSEDTDKWVSVVEFKHRDVLFENATLLVTPDG